MRHNRRQRRRTLNRGNAPVLLSSFLLLLLFAITATCEPGTRTPPQTGVVLGATLEEPPELPSSSVGRIEGSLAVTPEGVAQYVIPIRVPPGRAGLQPDLALVYNSNQRFGNIGVGWSLSGFSQIERCGHNLAYDGFIDVVKHDISDNFCLDGTRLIHLYGNKGKDGAVYATKKESFSKIVLHGEGPEGPDYFEVHTKDGKIMLYGCDGQTMESGERGSCSALIYGRNDVRRAWALRQVRDRHLNYMRMAYVRWDSTADEDWDNDGVQDYTGSPETVEFAPRMVEYTGKMHPSERPADKRVEFYYTWNRADRYGHRMSYRGALTYRLKKIVTWVKPSKQALIYTLQYKRSDTTGRPLVESVTLCDPQSTCLPPTYFEWQDEQEPLGTLWEASADLVPNSEVFQSISAMTPTDVNGDGKQDLVYVRDGRWRLLKSTGSSVDPFVEEVELFSATEIRDNDGRIDWVDRAYPMDVNNDGKEDLIIQASEADILRIFLATGDSAPYYQEQTVTLDDNTTNDEKRKRRLLFGDINGDGLPDYLFCPVDAQGSSANWTYRFNAGDGTFSPLQQTTVGCNTDASPAGHYPFLLDINGDGANELMFVFPGSNPYQRDYHALEFVHGVPQVHYNVIPAQSFPRTADVNGDGLRDVIQHPSTVPFEGEHDFVANLIHVWLNTGNGFIGGKDGLRAGRIPINYISWIKRAYPRPWLPDYIIEFEVAIEYLPWHSIGDFTKDGRDDLLITDTINLFLTDGQDDVRENCEGLETNVYIMKGSSATRDFVDAASLGRQALMFFPDPITSFPICSRSGRWLYDYEVIADIDGDSQPDIVKIAGDRLMVQFDNRPQKDLMIGIRDGLIGIKPDSVLWDSRYTHRIEYRNSTDSEVYTQQLLEGTTPACNHPTQCGRPKGDLVYKHYGYNGENAQVSVARYSYHDSRYSRHGLGWLGFGQTVVVDEHTGKTIITDRNNHYRDPQTRMYPYQGMTNRVKTFVLDEMSEKYLVDVSIATFEQYNLGMWNNGLTYLPYARDTVSTRYLAVSHSNPIDAEMLSEFTKVVTLDEYGNVVKLESSDSDGNRRTTDLEYDYDLIEWFIGLLKHATETSSTPSGSATRVRDYTYDPGTGALMTKRRVYENGDHLLMTYTRDDFGNASQVVTQTESGEVRTYDYVYDAESTYVYQITNGKNHTIRYAFDEKTGQVTVHRDPNGVLRMKAYDTFGRLRRIIPPQGTETAVEYGTVQIDNISFLTRSVLFGSELLQRSIYDSAGRVQRREDRTLNAKFNVTDIEYGRNGKRSYVSLPYTGLSGSPAGRIHYLYDNAGRLIEQHNPDNTSVHAVYGENTVEEYSEYWVNGYHHYVLQRTLELNASGKITSVTDADGESTYHYYGPFGFPTEIIDAAGSSTTYSRNEYGFLELIDDKNSGLQTARYNSYGELKEVVDGNGDSINFYHDSLGRVVERQSKDGNTEYTYDEAPNGIGKIDAVSDTNGNVKRYQYDLSGRAYRTHTTMRSGEVYWFTTWYGSNGLPERLDYPAFPSGSKYEIRYSYDAAGIPTKITNNVTQRTIYEINSVNEFGQVTAETFGNNHQTLRTYNELTSRLESIKTSSASIGSIQHIAYDYYMTGNLKSRSNIDNATMSTKDIEYFRYDRLHRLIENKYCWNEGTVPEEICNPARSVTYDSVGNITSRSGVGIYTYNANKPHAVENVSGLGSYSYDDAGNQIDRPKETVTYNSTGLISDVKSKSDSSLTSFAYDHAFNRIAKYNPDGSERRYMNGVFEHYIDGRNEEFVYYVKLGSRIISMEQRKWDSETNVTEISTKYVHQDSMGSAETVTDDSGVVLQKLSFDPFGAPREANWDGPPSVVEDPSVGLRYGFTGHEHDEYNSGSSIVNAGGRFYDQKIGRFLSPDPVSIVYNTQGMNKYSYVNNRPMNLVDPTGRFPTIGGTHVIEAYGPDPGMMAQLFSAMGRALAALAPAISELLSKHVIVDFHRTRNVQVYYNKPTVYLGAMSTRSSAWQTNNVKGASSTKRGVYIISTPVQGNGRYVPFGKIPNETAKIRFARDKAENFGWRHIWHDGADSFPDNILEVLDPDEVVIFYELTGHAGDPNYGEDRHGSYGGDHSYIWLASKDSSTETDDYIREYGSDAAARKYMLYSDSKGVMYNIDIFRGVPFDKYNCTIVLSGCNFGRLKWGQNAAQRIANDTTCNVVYYDGPTLPTHGMFMPYSSRPRTIFDTEYIDKNDASFRGNTIRLVAEPE